MAKSNTKRHLIFLLKLAIVFFCCWFAYHNIAKLGPRQVWAVAKQCDPLWLTLSVLALAGRFIIWSFKWNFMLKRQEGVAQWPSLWACNKQIMAAAFINLVTPTAKLGGSLFRAFHLRQKYGWPTTAAFGWPLADQLISLVGSMLLLGPAAFAVALEPSFADHRLLLFVLGSVTLLLVLIWLPVRPSIWRWLGKLRRPRWFMPEMLASRANMDETPKKSWQNYFKPMLVKGKASQIISGDFLLSALSLAMLYLANTCVVTGMGSDAPIALLTAAVMAAYLIGSVLGVMGGIGVTELFLMQLYPMAGVAPEIAAAAALLHRGIFYVYVLGIGGLSFWQERAILNQGNSRLNHQTA